ncbi:hypothetical protein M3Y95_01010600 [Aphelenchoides besseyi]|nr:hypothetical protein M3Y95_01010600 [Aphelenchoides besseyi]
MPWFDFPSWKAGWERLKKFYNLDELCMERDITTRTLRTVFIVGGIVGGLSGRQEAERRLQMYTTGMTFGSRANRFTRTMDYRILAFLRNGLRYGVRSGVLIGSILMTTSHLTLYRDRFSLWYLPAISGAVCLVTHRASACAFFSFPLGLYGLVQATTLGITAGTTLSSSVYLYSLYLDKTVDEAYRVYREEYEKQIEERRQTHEDMKQLAKESNLWTLFGVRKTLLKKKEDRAKGLGADLDDEDDEEDDEKAEKPAVK